jgi:hypothetical protein
VFPETEIIPHIKIGEAPKITLQTLVVRCNKYGILGCVLATVDDHQLPYPLTYCCVVL